MLSRRAVLRALPTLGLVALAACQPAATPTPPPPPTPTGGPAITPIIASTDLAVGPNRFALGILDPTNRPITDAEVHLRFYALSGEQAVLRSEGKATFFGEGLDDRGLYVVRTEFPEAGNWGVEVLATRGAASLPPGRVSFAVLEQSRTPAIGAPALETKNSTTTEGRPASELCTADPPCAMHDLVIADVVGSGRPLALYFGTPAYCSSRVCGPGLEVVQALQEKHGDQAAFIHIEIFKDPENGVARDEVLEWKLPSEPWLFLIDGAGTVVDKYEGGITLTEVGSAVARLTSTST